MTTPVFTIAHHAEPDGVLRVCLAGALREAAGRPGVTRVLVDLAQTRLIDSHAVAGLVAGYQAATSAGRSFTVVNGRGLVQQVLDITGLSEVLCARP